MAGSNKQRAQQDFRKIDNIDDTDDPLTCMFINHFEVLYLIINIIFS